VLDNLLANVRAHTPPGTPGEVIVRQEGETVVITVTDRGPGLAPDEAARVFERFYRADRSRSRAHGGTGLGLGIVAAIVAAHGGRVTVSSEPGHGSTFVVRLPVDNRTPLASDSPTVAPSGGEDRIVTQGEGAR
jgi:two-component system, OmpR family, sensor kinase